MKLKDITNILQRFLFLIFWMITGYMAGDSGMGFFFAAAVIYHFLYLLFLSAISDTIAKLVSARKSKGFHDNAQKVFYFGVATSIGIGLFFGLILGLGGMNIMTAIYGYSIPSSILVFYGIFFFITSINNCLGGYAKGLGYGRYVIFADLAQYVLLIICAPVIIKKMTQYGIKVSYLLKNSLFTNLDGAIGAIITQCGALAISTIVIIVLTMFIHSSAPMDSAVRGINNKRTFVMAYVTTTLNNIIDKMGLVLALLTLTIMYVKAGAGYQADTNELFTTLGVFAGKYISVLAVPLILFSEYVSRERKRIRTEYNHDEHNMLRLRAGNLLKNTLYMMIPATATIIILSKPIVYIFFGGKMSLGATLVAKGGIVLILIAISSSCRAMLRAVELDIYAAVSILAGYVAMFIFMLTSISSGLNINLMVYSLIIFYLIQAAVTAFLIYRMIDVYIIDIAIKAGKVLAATLCMGIVMAIIDKFFVLNAILLPITVIIGYVVYFVVIGIIQGVNEKELKSLQGTLTYYPTYIVLNILGNR